MTHSASERSAPSGNRSGDKVSLDTQVEEALFRRAVGFEYHEEKHETDKDGNKKTSKTTKLCPPDVRALIFWLKNRRPDRWRDKPACDDSAGLKEVSEILVAVRKAAENDYRVES